MQLQRCPSEHFGTYHLCFGRSFPAGPPLPAVQALQLLHQCCSCSPPLCEAVVQTQVLETLLAVREGPHGTLALLTFAAVADGVSVLLTSHKVGPSVTALLPGMRSDDYLRLLATQLQPPATDPEELRAQYATCSAIAALLRIYLLASSDRNLQNTSGELPHVLSAQPADWYCFGGASVGQRVFGQCKSNHVAPGNVIAMSKASYIKLNLACVSELRLPMQPQLPRYAASSTLVAAQNSA